MFAAPVTSTDGDFHEGRCNGLSATMLTHPTIDLLHALGLNGMAKGVEAFEATPETRELGHAEWPGLLLDHEVNCAARTGSSDAPGRHGCVTKPASRTSTSRLPADSIGR
jgi:hypothetical protein